jgi:membrane protein insertase Oxa1/YidC/SpoIIIJ
MDLTRLSIFYVPIFNLVVFLYSTLWGNLGIAIIIVALISKIVTIPITLRQQKMALKTKDVQKKMEEIKERYKNDVEMQTKELAKHQGQILSSTLSGCLPLIITILLIITVRSVVVDLVDRGWESYNNVAFVESTKKSVNSLTYKLEEDLKLGQNDLSFDFVSSNGNKYSKVVTIFTYDTDAQKEEYKKKWDEIRAKVLEKPSEISLYSKVFNEEKSDKHVIGNKRPELMFYLRAASNETVDMSKTKVMLNGVDITPKVAMTAGEALNLDFLGMNISKVATSFTLGDPLMIPYVVLAILYAISSLFYQRQAMKMNPTPVVADKPKVIGKDGKEPAEDMQKMMGNINGQMMYVFTGMAFVTSLGFWGGAQIFPSGLTIFWTAQNLFGIIQNLIQAKLLKKNGQGKTN